MIRKLVESDREEFFYLLDEVMKNLTSSDFLIPMTEDEKKFLFDDSKEVFYGYFLDDKLVGASGLYFEDDNDAAEYLNLSTKNLAEIGHSMVLPSMRGQNIMLLLNYELLNYAKQNDIKILIATAHPDNIASNKSLQKLGMNYLECYVRLDKYLRNIYILEI